MVEPALATKEITHIEPNSVLSSNPTFLVTLKDGIKCIWKFCGPRWRKEVAAYKVSTLLGFDIVPPTVRRIINGRAGSLQLYCDSVPLDRRNVVVKGVYGLECRTVVANQLSIVEIQRRKLFDFVIDCEDRSPFRNWLLTSNGRIFCIDHEHGFRDRIYCPVPNASLIEFMSMREAQSIKNSILNSSTISALEAELLPLIGSNRTSLVLGRIKSLKR